MRMSIGFYGQIAALFGGRAELEVPELGLPVYGLRAMLAGRYDVDAVLQRSMRAAVNDEVVAETHVVRPGDTVEFMSPVSGG